MKTEYIELGLNAHAYMISLCFAIAFCIIIYIWYRYERSRSLLKREEGE